MALSKAGGNQKGLVSWNTSGKEVLPGAGDVECWPRLSVTAGFRNVKLTGDLEVLFLGTMETKARMLNGCVKESTSQPDTQLPRALLYLQHLSRQFFFWKTVLFLSESLMLLIPVKLQNVLSRLQRSKCYYTLHREVVEYSGPKHGLQKQDQTLVESQLCCFLAVWF